MRRGRDEPTRAHFRSESPFPLATGVSVGHDDGKSTHIIGQPGELTPVTAKECQKLANAAQQDSDSQKGGDSVSLCFHFGRCQKVVERRSDLPINLSD